MRVVAILFLLYTGADIILPEYFCRSNAQLFASDMMATDKYKINVDNHLSVVTRDSDSQGENERDQVPLDEDCFCCGAHVLPSTLYIYLNAEIATSLLPAIKQASIPTPPVLSLYHPPRIA